MRRFKLGIKHILLIYLILEIFVLTIVAKYCGALVTILLIVLTTALGISQLKQQQAAIMEKMRKMNSNSFMLQQEFSSAEGMRSLGCICLILPGFITDIVGLLLLMPWFRQFILKKLIKSSNKTASGGDTFEAEFQHKEDITPSIAKKDENNPD
jgi:UPF0716 protein FxsA